MTLKTFSAYKNSYKLILLSNMYSVFLFVGLKVAIPLFNSKLLFLNILKPFLLPYLFPVRENY